MGRTALIWAAKRNDLRMIELLIRFNPDTNWIDKEGYTALLYAVKLRNPEMIIELIVAGSRTRDNAVEYGKHAIGDKTTEYLIKTAKMVNYLIFLIF